MKVGFIGAGRVGCSIGKYFVRHGIHVTGYYNRNPGPAKWAAEFTETRVFETMEECVSGSEAVMIAVPDDAICPVWNQLRGYPVKGKVFCHFSGALASDVFDGIDAAGAYGCSLHPMYAFADRETAYRGLDGIGFTIEGADEAVQLVRGLLEDCHNPVIRMQASQKVRYHAAASMLSNHVAGVLSCGYELLEEAGFSEEQARTFSGALVLGNVRNVIENGAMKALTGPIERGDVETVRQHLHVLTPEQEEMYRANGRRLVEIAQRKHPDRSYDEMKRLLEK